MPELSGRAGIKTANRGPRPPAGRTYLVIRNDLRPVPSRYRRDVLRTLGAAGALGGCTRGPDPGRTATTTRTEPAIERPDPTPTATERPTDVETETATQRDEQCETAWDPARLWRDEAGIRAYRPVVVDGVAYFGAQDDVESPGVLSALDAATGRARWRRPQAVRLYGRPAVAAGRVVVTDYGTVTAVDAASGDRRWTFAPPGEYADVDTNPAVAGGRVFVGTSNYAGREEDPAEDPYTRLVALSLAGGGTEWHRTVRIRGVFEGLAVAAGTVYAARNDGVVTALDGASGERLWARRVGARGGSYDPVLDGGNVHVQVGGTLAALDAANGTVRWRRRGDFRDDPAVADGVVYCATGRELASFEAATGRPRWRSTLHGDVDGRVTATPDVVYVSVEGTAGVTRKVAVDAATGCRLGSYPVEAAGVTRATVANDVVYFGGLNGDGALFAVRSPSVDRE